MTHENEEWVKKNLFYLHAAFGNGFDWAHYPPKNPPWWWDPELQKTIDAALSKTYAEAIEKALAGEKPTIEEPPTRIV